VYKKQIETNAQGLVKSTYYFKLSQERKCISAHKFKLKPLPSLLDQLRKSPKTLMIGETSLSSVYRTLIDTCAQSTKSTKQGPQKQPTYQLMEKMSSLP